MRAAQEELISEMAVARYSGVPPQRVRGFASQGLLQSVRVQGPNGLETVYDTGEVLRVKERLRGQGTEPEPPAVA